jgi:hypothetical protein
MTTYYDILSIDRNASPQQIKNAYRNLMKHHHPDLHEDSEEATQQAQTINKAYAVLKDPVRRYEYDNLLTLRRSSVETPEDTSPDISDEGLSVSDIPQYVCEGCGRHDASLRVTIFLWVVSLIFTWKRGWGRILCSRCRLKYSILWNIEVWVAGWWGIPFGPPHSIEALMKNSSGGIQPTENNASLLAALADDFYHQHRYLEARCALEDSLKLHISKGGLEFLHHIKQLVRKENPGGIPKSHKPLNPLAINVPLLSILSIVSLWIILSMVYPVSEPIQTVPSQIQAVEEDALSKMYGELASKLGIQLEVIDQSHQICKDGRTKISRHIISESLKVMPDQSEGETIEAPEVDWTKLNEELLHQQTENIRIALEQASVEIQKLEPIDSKDKSIVDPSSLQFSRDLHAKLYDMTSIYFNCALLEYSTPLMKRYSSAQGVFPQRSVDNIHDLGLKPDVATWLKRVHLDNSYNQLLEILTKVQMEDGRYSVMTERLTTLRDLVREDSSVLSALSKKIEYYKNARMTQEYDQTVALYNQRVPAGRAHVEEYNDYIMKYNEFVKTVKDQDITTALDACLDRRVFFPDSRHIGF